MFAGSSVNSRRTCQTIGAVCCAREAAGSAGLGKAPSRADNPDFPRGFLPWECWQQELLLG